MIGSRFTYASMKVGFGSAFGSTTNSSYKTLQAKRASIAASLSSTQSALSAITSAFATAQQDKISGLANLAARAAIARVQEDAKAKKAEALKQIDGAQKTLDDAKTAGKPAGTTIVGNTVIQKYVSWALTPTIDTTA